MQTVSLKRRFKRYRDHLSQRKTSLTLPLHVSVVIEVDRLKSFSLTLQALFVTSLAHCSLAVTWLPQTRLQSSSLIK